MKDIKRKEELTNYLNRSVNKWRKIWNINQNEKEASQTVQFIRQFYVETIGILAILQGMYSPIYGRKDHYSNGI
jgi:hypothetical protein